MAYSTRGFMGLLISINLSSFYRTLHIPAGITQVVGRALPLHEGVVGVNVFGDADAHGVVIKSEVFLGAAAGATDFSDFAFNPPDDFHVLL